MIGETFGRWLVIGEATRDYNRQARWRCVCLCGQSATVHQNALRRGDSRSCGGCTQRKSPLLLALAPSAMTLGASVALYSQRRPTIAELSAAMRHSNKRRKALGT